MIETRIKDYLDSIQFSETILYPGNYLELDYDKYDYKEVLGNRHSGFYYAGYEPIFLVKSVKYKDGNVRALKDTVSYPKSSFAKGISLDGSRPVEELKVEVHYRFPKVNSYSFREDKLTLSLPDGAISLKT